MLLSTLLDFSGAYADLTAASPKLIISIASTLPGGQTNRPAGDYTDTVILNGNYASFVGASPFNDCNFSGTSAAPVSFDVTATVPSNCNIAATPLTFPTQVIFDADVTAQSAITVSCTNGSPYWVGLDNGLNSISGQRRMRSGPNYINYDLFRDAGLSMRWGATKNVDTVSGTGASSGTTLTVYGVAPKPLTLPMPATYTDSVVATVNF